MVQAYVREKSITLTADQTRPTSCSMQLELEVESTREVYILNGKSYGCIMYINAKFKDLDWRGAFL
jgi:hypothetical protein